MNRKTFISLLKKELNRRNDLDIEEVVFYYDELIQDAVDAGEDEALFIENLGSIKDIVHRLEDDDAFIVKVKEHNQNALRKTIHLSTKVIVYFLLGIVGLLIALTGISVLVSGFAIIVMAFAKVVFVGGLDVYGYLAYVGIALIGLSLVIFSIALIQWHFTGFRSSLLALLRKTKNVIGKRG